MTTGITLDADQRALAAEHVPLAERMARRAATRWPRLRDEFHSAAQLALVECAGRWRPVERVAFSCYARRRIKGAIVDACRVAAQHGFGSVGWRRGCAAPAGGAAADRALGADDPVAAAAGRDGLARLLGRILGGRDRQIIVLRYVEGLSRQDTAARVGCCPTTVKNRELWVLRRLRTCLEAGPGRTAGRPHGRVSA